MTLADLLAALGDLAPDARSTLDASLAERVVKAVAYDSRKTGQGSLFVALKGQKADGSAFAVQALSKGALAVVAESERPRDVQAPWVVVPDARLAMARLAAAFYRHPSRELKVVGITGTNGKTTTAYLVTALFEAAAIRCGMLGTVVYRIGLEDREATRTTPESVDVQHMLREMVTRECGACAMEVSSHALSQRRVDGTRFAVGVFTNLTRDHLDFHGDMAGYFADKVRLFAPGQARRGVVVVDDEWGRRLVREAQIPVESLATHVGAPEGATASWAVVAATIGLDGVGSTFTLRGPDGATHEAFSPLPGLVNVSNAALAIVLAYRAGVDLETAIAAVGRAHAIPGRMERVIERADGWPLALVDYAHTPDALALALEAVRPITPGRLIIVFGSDGDRDRGKRPMMGEIAARLADVLVVTDENPRSEVPGEIRAAILAGARAQRPGGADIYEVTSRGDAIRAALALAAEPDTIIITGKGHEPTQEIAGVFHRYNDRDVLRAAVRDARVPAGTAE